MKKFWLFTVKITIFSLVILSFVSCRKDYFNNINSVEASGEWGVPLLNSDIYIGDVLSSFAAMDIEEDASSGMLKFSLFMDSTQLIRPTEMLQINNHVYSNSFSFPAPSGDFIPPVNEFQMTFQSDLLDQDNFEIEEGIVKSGTITITINTDIDQSNYSIHISSPNIFDAQNAPFEVVFTPTTLTQTIDLTGFKFVIGPADLENTISYTTTVYITDIVSSPLSQYVVQTDFESNSVLFKSLKGKMDPKSYPVRFTNPISFFSDNLSGNFTLLNPKYSVKVGNSVGAACRFIADSVGFRGPGFYSTILNPGTQINCDASTGNGYYEITVNEGTGNELVFSNQVKEFLFDGNAIINPLGMSAGTITIDDQAAVYVTSRIEVGLESKFDYVEYMDTIDFQMDDVKYNQVIEEAVLRLAIVNGIPLSGEAQLYFYDSQQNIIIDTLMPSPQIFRAATSAGAPDYQVISPTTSVPKLITITGTQFTEILKADKIIVRCKLYSENPNNIIRIYQNQKMSIRLGAKIKYNTNSVEL